MDVSELAAKVLEGGSISRQEALELYEQPIGELQKYADKIRRAFCDNQFDICTIINAKSGTCSEDCKFCAQSAYNCADIEKYPLISVDEIVRLAKMNHEQGVLRYSIVTSGKNLSDSEVDIICEAVKRIKAEVGISVCGSFGLLNKEQLRKLKAAGVSRIHNNLETSRRNFPNVCTTHSFEDKLTAIRAAQAAGFSVCSGGLMGMGETPEDRVDMAFMLKELNIKSIPVNMLNPIPKTPFENNVRLGSEDIKRIVAVYRFILPDAYIRLAGGRGLLSDKGKDCFISGANAAISGDMLTTAGITVEKDLKLIKALGYEV